MSDAVIVNVGQGALKGRVATTKSGGSYFSFQGIPYAQPPVGPLRFKAPLPPKPWEGTRDALIDGNVCPQIDEFTNELVGDEDCLFVNVYTPQLPVNGQEAEIRQAVMVYIHGGGFTTGSGNTVICGPDYLIDEGVVVVTINYRLAAFGFLSTDDGEIPGNLGMKDQVAALRWVQQNIARFGGDPSNVTIFGESAGAASVHYHLLSPMSKGLFHRAISQSGCALNPWAYIPAFIARIRTVNLAKALGCKSETSKDLLAFFNGVSATQLATDIRIGITEQESRRGVWYPFVPCSEANDGTSEKFLPTDPLEIITSGKINHVPYITGVNSNEGLILLKELNRVPESVAVIDNDFQRFLPAELFPELDTDNSREAAQKLKKFYFGDKPFSEDTILEYTQLNTDLIFLHKIMATAKMHLTHSPPPIYMYQFSFEGQLGLYKIFCGASKYPGVCHADDLGYLFHISLMSIDLPADAPEVKVRSILVKMWATFAKTGNPSVSVTWNPISPDKMGYMKIDLEPKMLENMEHRRLQFWDNLYKPKCHCERNLGVLNKR